MRMFLWNGWSLLEKNFTLNALITIIICESKFGQKINKKKAFDGCLNFKKRSRDLLDFFFFFKFHL